MGELRAGRDEIHGKKAKDLPNFIGLLRPGDSGAIDEGSLGGVGAKPAPVRS